MVVALVVIVVVEVVLYSISSSSGSDVLYCYIIWYITVALTKQHSNTVPEEDTINIIVNEQIIQIPKTLNSVISI